MCVWQAESSGKGGQEQAAFPPSPAHLQHPSIWQGQVGSAVGHMASEMLLKKLQTCALPSLSPLCVLAPDREAADFSAAPFQYWDRVRKLAKTY